MALFLSGLVGVVVGGGLVLAASLVFLGRRADRDLVERRLRLCAEYRDCLGDLSRALNESPGEPAVLEQAWINVANFCREYRLTSWVLEPRSRETLDGVVEELEAARVASTVATEEGFGGRRAQALCELYVRLDRSLRGEIERQYRAFHLPAGQRFGFLPRMASSAIKLTVPSSSTNLDSGGQAEPRERGRRDAPKSLGIPSQDPCEVVAEPNGTSSEKMAAG